MSITRIFAVSVVLTFVTAAAAAAGTPVHATITPVASKIVVPATTFCPKGKKTVAHCTGEGFARTCWYEYVCW
jgi:hypothetical protein